MSNVGTSPSFPQRLKTETLHLHQELESLPISQSILKSEVPSEDYLIYLGLMFDIISDIESSIFPILSKVVSDLSERKKIHLIEHDFLKLGYSKKSIYQHTVVQA